MSLVKLYERARMRMRPVVSAWPGAVLHGGSRRSGRSLRCWAGLLLVVSHAAQADAVDALRAFVRDVQSGQARFTQTVTSPDGARTKTSSGEFDFARPNRFRFAYQKPFEQLIVADGQKVWIYDAELNQASSRRLAQALGDTPAAILAGRNLEPAFKLSNLPSGQGLDWALAAPRTSGGTFQELRVGFRGKELAAIEIVDSFGQRSRLDFARFAANAPVPESRFEFKPPVGADVVEQ
jgi:outer membrane lipoprotein carrier protein